MTRPLVSIVCVTENRAPFLPWLFWNVQKQTYRPLELVLVDSSSAPLEFSGCFSVGEIDHLTILHAPQGSTVGEKMNLALGSVDGEFLCKWDDDDWYNPDFIDWLTGSILEAPYAGWNLGWFVNLRTEQYLGYRHDDIVCAASMFRTELAKEVPWDTEPIASDTRWMRQMVRRAEKAGLKMHDAVHSLWLQHGQNLNTRKLVYGGTLWDLIDKMGKDAWRGSDEKLKELRRRLASGNS